MATRLNVILLIPVLVALVFGGFRVKSSVDTWQAADDAVRTADLVRAASTYSSALIDERDVSAVPLLAGRRDDPSVLAARDTTDQAADAFDQAAARIPDEAGLRRRMANFRTVEPQLASLRKAAYTRQLPGVQTEEWYVRIQHPLMELANELGYGTSNITAYGRTLYAVSLARAAESLTRSIGTHILVQKQVPARELALQKTALGSYQYLQDIALEEYHGGGTPADQARLRAALETARKKGEERITAAQDRAEAAHAAYVVPPDLSRMVSAIGAPGSTAATLRAQGITPAAYFGAATLTFDAYRSVEEHLTGRATVDAGKIASDAKRDAIVNSAIVMVALALAFVVAALMARAMSNRMRRLRGAAFEIAGTRLPSLVDQLSRTDPGRVDTRVAPIPINSRDEIGEVARAFDQVHREAVRLAAEQALLRGNVNAIFTNLSLRNQGLIERQLALITELENSEADPEQLDHLFKMDHLATRMRRNGENLLVLAGEEPGREWDQPVPLVDVMRAAASEVEAYDRIELVGIPESDIHGSAVGDLVHLLAELLENATTFSSPQTRVRVTATRLPDGRVMVEIHDRGIGLTPEDFADINRKLADPPTVDVEIARRMGLFVVGRLSDRHGIRVQLRPSGEQAGTTSLVMLPEAITRGGGGEELNGGAADQDFTVSRIVPEHPAGALGLPREERRAQLEAAVTDRQKEVSLPQQRQEPPAYEETYAEPYEEPYAQGFVTGGGHGFDQSYDPAYQQSAYAQDFQDTGYGEPGGHERSPGYQQDGFAGQGYEQGFEQPYDPGYDHQTEFSGHTPAQDGWPAAEAEVTESAPPLPRAPRESVVSPSLTDAGLPRRERQQRTSPYREEPARESPETPGAPSDMPQPEEDSADWRSTNDEHWQRAEQVREPKAGGVTPSGLPRRVPRANLVPGAATQTTQGGPQVSRAPEDVRGRLSNLRRGVRQGRTAGTDTNGQAADSGFGGPQNQER
ncbi:nitrate- and nitrite sensing domain-containing protein [Streptomyces sp.]|uniref:sensor histidine kinase n=1 Tax=Streptomyces sp. TaxID=1931 RepID=UPI002F419088